MFAVFYKELDISMYDDAPKWAEHDVLRLIEYVSKKMLYK